MAAETKLGEENVENEGGDLTAKMPRQQARHLPVFSV